MQRYASNYVLIVVALFVYCVVSSPLLLVVVAALGAAWFVSTTAPAFQIGPLSIGSRERSIGLACVTVIACLYLSVGSTIVWVAGASLLIVLAHASLRRPIDDVELSFKTMMHDGV